MPTPAEEKYADIIHLPHRRSPSRVPMSRYDRAAQFSPFAALTGYDAAVAETARLTDSRIELTEDLLDNLVLMKKGEDELTATVNGLLAKAKEAGLYEVWYAEALELAGVGVEISYDDEGNLATEGN